MLLRMAGLPPPCQKMEGRRSILPDAPWEPSTTGWLPGRGSVGQTPHPPAGGERAVTLGSCPSTRDL